MQVFPAAYTTREDAHSIMQRAAHVSHRDGLTYIMLSYWVKYLCEKDRKNENISVILKI